VTELCMMLGIFLYCGNSPTPTAMFTQSNNLPTEHIAQVLLQSQRKRERDAQPTLQCPRWEIPVSGQCLKIEGVKP
jgi:hypothetical protein